MKIPPAFQDASLEERIEFVQMLWDEIARNADSVLVTDEHRAILDERIRAYEEDRNSGEPWGGGPGSNLGRSPFPLKSVYIRPEATQDVARAAGAWQERSR
ncbi:MAG: addiction module protein [Pseudomonadales bacterium]